MYYSNLLQNCFSFNCNFMTKNNNKNYKKNNNKLTDRAINPLCFCALHSSVTSINKKETKLKV